MCVFSMCVCGVFVGFGCGGLWCNVGWCTLYKSAKTEKRHIVTMHLLPNLLLVLFHILKKKKITM